MRLASGLLAFSFLTIAACGGGGGSGDDGGDDGVDAGDPPPPEFGFQIITPDITIEAGDERTYCYYTTVDIDQAMGVKRWSSTMAPGSHHLIVYFTDTALQPDETVSESCGGGAGFGPVWTYSAGTPEAENAMPEGVGMTVGAQQHLFVQLHYFNANPSEAITAHAVINAEAYAPEEEYTPAAAFITFNTEIDIPPSSQNGTDSVSGTCTVPAGMSFFTLSTHSHRRSVYTAVHDGPDLVFESEDWEHPGATDWRAAPHFQFESGQLTYSCDFVNDIDQRVTTGDSADVDEMCMAVGYMFPASSPTFCLNSTTF